MNDPKVVALIYTVDHGNSVSYENAGPLRNFKTPEFELTVENKIARFEFKKHYADKDEALKAIEPFIRHWEFLAEIDGGPNSFSLWYEGAEMVDRKPSPSEPGIRKLRASFRVKAPTITARISHLKAEYPPPPSGGSVDPDDPDVVKMKDKYDQYRLGKEKLPVLAYFCMTVLEDKYRGRPAAARDCEISKKVLYTIW